MDSPGEILSLCRLCLVKDQVNIPIFEEQGDIRQIFLKISSCLPVTITRHDQLPKKICDACSNKLDLLYEFWNSSASAEKTLLSWLGQAGVKDAGEKISAVAQQIAKPAETLVKEESEALDESQLINEANVINETNLTNESRDSFEEHSLDEDTKDEAEAPPPKRARRTAAVKAQINITPESDEDDDEDYDAGDAMTKMEDESDESESELKDDPSYSEVPGTSADDQAGPSGVGKDGVEAPQFSLPERLEQTSSEKISNSETSKEEIRFEDFQNPDTSMPANVTEASGVPKTNIDDETGRIMVKQFFCQKCGLKFENFGDLHRHIFTCDESHLFRCANCNSVVGKIYMNIILHTKRVCSRVAFKNAERELLKKNPDEKRYYCERCGQGVGLLNDLLQHYTQHNNELLCCSLCDMKYSAFMELLVHFRGHALVGQIYLPCKTCTKVFFDPVPYRLHHLIVHSRINNISYECDLCDKIFVDEKGAFISHVEGHFQALNTSIKSGRPKKDVSRLTCEVCAEIFDTVFACKQHKAIEHFYDENAESKCPECEHMIAANNILDHLITHDQNKASTSSIVVKNVDAKSVLDEEAFCLVSDVSAPQSLPKASEAIKLESVGAALFRGQKRARIQGLQQARLSKQQEQTDQPLLVPADNKLDSVSKTTASICTTEPKPVSRRKSRKCKLCGKILGSRQSLRRHMKTESIHSSRKTTLSTDNSQGDNFHVVSKPTLSSSANSEQVSMLLKCRKCGKSVGSGQALKKHLKTHLNLSQSQLSKQTTQSEKPQSKLYSGSKTTSSLGSNNPQKVSNVKTSGKAVGFKQALPKKFDAKLSSMNQASFNLTHLKRSHSSDTPLNIKRQFNPTRNLQNEYRPSPFLTPQASLQHSTDQTLRMPWNSGQSTLLSRFTSSANSAFDKQAHKQQFTGFQQNVMPINERCFIDRSEIERSHESSTSRRVSSTLSFRPPGEFSDEERFYSSTEQFGQHSQRPFQPHVSQTSHQVFSSQRVSRYGSSNVNNYGNCFDKNTGSERVGDYLGSLGDRMRGFFPRSGFSNLPRTQGGYGGRPRPFDQF